MKLHLGKAKATKDKRDLKFSTYLTTLPPIPSHFGFDHVVDPKAWGMLGNDEYGDCVWAGAAHEQMVLGARGSGIETFTTNTVLSDYSRCTGFSQGDPNSDQGTNVRDAMKYRQGIGVLTADGKRHKVGAYLSLDPKNLAEVWQALYVFEVVGIGIEFPSSAMTQFNYGQPWSVVKGSPIEGGHYVPILSKQGVATCKVVTWGSLQTVTQDFLTTYCDEAWCYVSPDSLNAGKTWRGFNMAQLSADLAALK